MPHPDEPFEAAPLIEASITPGCRILVTGGTGFTSGWMIKLCLEQGYKVRTTVRKFSPAQNYLRALAANVSGDIEIVECELTSSQDVWDAAVLGCEGVAHIASPMDFGAADPLNDLVMPQLTGTERILVACKKHGVKRVVITSSTQTLSSTTPEWQSRLYTEEDWNREASLTRYAYPYSKLLQEKLATDFSRKNALSVVTIVPYSICGPAVSPASPVNPTQEKIFATPLKGEVLATVDLSLGCVDVRDVALAHLRALERPQACGRYICWAECLGYVEFYKMMGELRPNLKHQLPTFILPRLFNWAIVCFLWLRLGRGVAEIVQAGLGKHPRFDVSRTERDLGFKFRPARETVEQSIRALEEWGVI